VTKNDYIRQGWIDVTKDQKKVMLEKLIELMWIYYCHIEGYTRTQPASLAIFYAYISAWKAVGLDVPDGEKIRAIMSEASSAFGGNLPCKKNDVREYVIKKYMETEPN
jgi:hypothetical protein